MEGVEPIPGRANYLIGNRPARWITSIPMFSKVRYRGIYQGVDLLFHSDGGGLEFDFILAPGVPPDVIQLRIDCAERIKLDGAGDLILLC